jgi:hypothetical protein
MGHDGRDIRADLNTSDGTYYTAPSTGQTAHLSFLAPEPVDGMARTVFAKVSGYYDIHHSSVAAKQDSTLRRIAEEPDYFARFALERYNAWRSENMALRSR